MIVEVLIILISYIDVEVNVVVDSVVVMDADHPVLETG